jgi:uncharacterized protein involved in exopolysaccharide biosynthesis
LISTLTLGNVYPDLAHASLNERLKMNQAVQRFAKSLRVLGVRKSNVITVLFQHAKAEIAAKAVNLLVDNFRDKQLCAAL